MNKVTLAIIIGVAVALLLLLRKGSKVFESLVVQKIAEAIAHAEGWDQPNSRPRRNHNPGNLTVSSGGKGVGYDGQFIVYATDQDGWDDLRNQIWLMFGGSRYYNSAMTILEIAKRWTTTQQLEWATNVASKLGVSINTQLSEIKA